MSMRAHRFLLRFGAAEGVAPVQRLNMSFVALLIAVVD
jgi:hypothetical protein